MHTDGSTDSQLSACVTSGDVLRRMVASQLLLFLSPSLSVCLPGTHGGWCPICCKCVCVFWVFSVCSEPLHFHSMFYILKLIILRLQLDSHRMNSWTGRSHRTQKNPAKQFFNAQSTRLNLVHPDHPEHTCISPKKCPLLYTHTHESMLVARCYCLTYTAGTVTPCSLHKSPHWRRHW